MSNKIISNEVCAQLAAQARESINEYLAGDEELYGYVAPETFDECISDLGLTGEARECAEEVWYEALAGALHTHIHRRAPEQEIADVSQAMHRLTVVCDLLGDIETENVVCPEDRAGLACLAIKDAAETLERVLCSAGLMGADARVFTSGEATRTREIAATH